LYSFPPIPFRPSPPTAGCGCRPPHHVRASRLRREIPDNGLKPVITDSMLFNSLQYALFLPVVFFIYWFITSKNLRLQNGFLLAASYFFYACWDWRFLFLLLFSTFLDFFSGLKIGKTEKRSKRLFWLWLSISINLGFLGVFKYYNFFATSFAALLSHMGLAVHPRMLNVV